MDRYVIMCLSPEYIIFNMVAHTVRIHIVQIWYMHVCFRYHTPDREQSRYITVSYVLILIWLASSANGQGFLNPGKWHFSLPQRWYWRSSTCWYGSLSFETAVLWTENCNYSQNIKPVMRRGWPRQRWKNRLVVGFFLESFSLFFLVCVFLNGSLDGFFGGCRCKMNAWVILGQSSFFFCLQQFWTFAWKQHQEVSRGRERGIRVWKILDVYEHFQSHIRDRNLGKRNAEVMGRWRPSHGFDCHTCSFSSHFGCWVMPLTFHQFAKEIGATKRSGFSKSIRELIYSFSYVCGVNLLLIQLISAKALKRIQIGLT